jgi:hypothetical protein
MNRFSKHTWEFNSYVNDYTDPVIENHNQTQTIPSPIFFFHFPDFLLWFCICLSQSHPTESLWLSNPALSSLLTCLISMFLSLARKSRPNFRVSRSSFLFFFPDTLTLPSSLSCRRPTHTSGPSSPNGDRYSPPLNRHPTTSSSPTRTLSPHPWLMSWPRNTTLQPTSGRLATSPSSALPSIAASATLGDQQRPSPTEPCEAATYPSDWAPFGQ